jgi:hypothetical protein
MKLAPLTRALLVFGLVTPVLVAQTPLSSQTAVGTPTYAGTYDVDSGTLTPGVPPDGAAVVIYDNTNFQGSFFQPGPGNYNMDWGTLSAGGNNFVTSVQIGYGTTSVLPVDIRIRLHQGATGFADPGVIVSDVIVTGLPPSASGGAEAFVVDIDLIPGNLVVNVADGPIGYSFEYFDAGTGPLLIDPPTEAGVVDAFDQYMSDDTYIGTFNFGGYNPSFGIPNASFWCQLTGDDEDPAVECLIFFGPQKLDPGIQFKGDPADILYLNPMFMFPVTIDTMPEWPIPNDPILDGIEIHWQVFMFNFKQFPADPWQFSNGLTTTLNDPGMPAEYGTSPTMDLWANQPALVGGTLDLGLAIQGL